MTHNLSFNPSKEVDPDNISAHTPGAKLDGGKPRPGLVLQSFSKALSAVTDVGTFGANKYTPRGWLSVAHGRDRYNDAMFRHLLKEENEPFDEDSGLLHSAHTAWNALARLELELREGGKSSGVRSKTG